MKDLILNDMVRVTGGSCYGGCKHAKPTGVVIKRWIIKGVVYYRDVQLKCPDCGEIFYRSKLF
ncbi:MAG: hypothetical protein IKE24_01420 [Clostridia bacterium]|nr:hypothetical protein [Clostridia bacterium]